MLMLEILLSQNWLKQKLILSIGIKFDETVRPLVLITPKVSGYVKTFKVKERNKDKISKLISFRICNEKLLEKYEAVWTKIEDIKNTELNALPVCNDRYIKVKIRTYSNEIYTNFCGLMFQKMI